MRKIYLFALLTLMVFALAGTVMAEPQTIEKQKAQEEMMARPSISLSSLLLQNHTILDETIIYETTFENADDWTVEDGSNDTYTWALVDTALQANRPMFQTGPFMWVDSDESPRESHLIEGLISPVIDPGTFPFIYMVCDLEYSDLNESDSLRIQYSSDGGTNWIDLEIFSDEETDDVADYPHVLDISDFAANNGTFQIRFLFDDGNTWAWYVGVDNFSIVGSDEVLDLEPPDVEITQGPASAFVGMDREIVALAMDDVSIASVTLRYGILVNNDVPEIFDVEMTATGNDNEFSGIIPGTFGVSGDTIAYVVVVEDGAGNTTADPPEAGNAYIFELYPESLAYQILELPSFNWMEVSITGTNLNLTDDQIVGLAFADFGFGTFTYFDEVYDSVYVSSNGWICFEPGASAWPYTPGMPNTSTPNGFISMCGVDLNPTLAGSIYAGVVDGKFVVQYGDDSANCYFFDEVMGPKGQIVLDGEMNVAYINYDTISGFLNEDETPFTDEHNMGIESPEGNIGVELFIGTEFNFPVNQSSYIITPPAGDISGYVYASDGTTPIENVEINLFEADESTILMTTTSASDGSYEFPIVIMGTYDIEVLAAGYVTEVVEDVEIDISESISLDFNLDVQTTTTAIQGYVFNADAAEETAVSGVDVYLVQYDMTATTDANGFFSFGDQMIGTYSFMVGVDPEGSNGYHNAIYPRVDIVESNPDIAFDVFEILAPGNLTATPGEISVSLAWEAPENHMTEELLVQRINARQEMLNRIDANPSSTDLIKAIPYRQELARLERRLAYLQQLETEDEMDVILDDINDFQGYLVSLDDTVLEMTVIEEEYTISGLENGTEYSFKVAADYGYGTEYLNWTDAVTATPNGIYLIDLERDFEWYDIRTTGTALNLTDDGVSDPLSLGGMIMEHYGVMYTQMYVSANGAIMLIQPDPEDLNLPNPFPTEDTPNAVVGPLWNDFDPADSEEENVWYEVDQENERVIVQWHSGPYPGPSTNIHDFELIIYPNLGEYVFSYLHSIDEWDLEGGAIGFEDETGTNGLGLNQEAVVSDSSSVMIGFIIPPRGTVSGNVVDTDGYNVEGAEVWLEGINYPIAITRDDGTFGPSTVRVGTHDFTFVHDEYWSVQAEDILVTEENNTVIPEVTLSYPNPRVSPSSLDLTFDLDNDEILTENFDLFNEGSGPMEFVASITIASRVNDLQQSHPVEIRNTPEFAKSLKTNRDNSGPVVSTQLDETWDLITGFGDIENGTGAQDNLGIAMNSSRFFISGFYYGTLTSFNYDGSFIEQVEYPAEIGGEDYSGLFGLSNDDDGYLYGGDENGSIFKFSPDMSEVTELGSIPGYPVAVAFDYDSQTLYTSTFGDPFYAMDNGGNTTVKTPSTLSIYGMAYVPMDEEGYTIYAHADDETNSHIIRYNPSTDSWDENPIATLYSTAHDDDIAGGLTSGVSSTGMYDFMTVQQGQAVDRADLWEGYGLQQWLTVSPADGTILSGGSQQLTITVNPSNDPDFEVQGGDEITSFVRITGPHMNDTVVLVTISFTAGVGEVVSELPQRYTLHQNYPNPFNPSTEIKFDLVQPQSVKLVVFNTLGQEVVRLVDAPMQAGYHVVSFDASTLASGVYFYRIETEAFTSMKKMIMVK